jgi:hypothetical protein
LWNILHVIHSNSCYFIFLFLRSSCMHIIFIYTSWNLHGVVIQSKLITHHHEKSLQLIQYIYIICVNGSRWKKHSFHNVSWIESFSLLLLRRTRKRLRKINQYYFINISVIWIEWLLFTRVVIVFQLVGWQKWNLYFYGRFLSYFRGYFN